MKSGRNMGGWLRRVWERVTKQGPAGSPTGELGEIASVIDSLERLNRCTEHDFLAVGEKLMALNDTARMIATDMEALTGFVSGAEGERIAATFESILELSRTMELRIEDGRTALESVQAAGDHIRQALSNLQRILPVVSVVGTVTRIETARFGAASGFTSVADEVKALTDNIRSKTETVLEASTGAGIDIARAVHELSDLQRRELKDLPEVARSVLASLGSFNERRAKALDTSNGMVVQLQTISDAIGEVVSLIQFHDITRQQVEHVIEALRPLASHRDRDSRVRRLLELESAQLANAREQFISSLARIREKLLDVERSLRQMIGAATGLFGDTRENQDGFFLAMEESLTTILRLLRQSSAADRSRFNAACDLGQTTGKMRDSVNAIEEVQLQMQRMALNTTIRAAHVGPAADPLAVLGGSIRQLAADCGATVEAARQWLDRMEQLIEGAQNGAEARSTADDRFGEDRIRQALEGLHSASESALCRSKQVEIVGTGMSADLRSLVAGLSAGREFESTAACCQATLDRLARACEGASSTVSNEELEGLTRRYTMSSEREIHEAVAGSVEEKSGEAEPIAVAGGDDLGENVELF